MNQTDFEAEFDRLTGSKPLSWQVRLWKDHFTSNHLPKIIDLPTGLGKTMVMAIWLIARMQPGSNLPRRLTYVVDRRTVVDQATDLAKKLRENVGEDKLAISTLRGQMADNREWSRDPSKLAIIIGTVDLIGSALLFSGYRSSYKRRPLEAGLLGQDSLLVLDEAHLSRPFEKLICALDGDGKFQRDRKNKAHGNPMRVMRMSATSGISADSNPPFTLLFDNQGNLTGEDAKDPTITERFDARKTLCLVESAKPAETIVEEAHKLAGEKPGSRIIIFVRTLKLVADVRKALEKKSIDYAAHIAQLTGTMRGLERDELVDTEKPLGDNDHERRTMQRFLKAENDASQGNCFLIATSAGEVGFDLNADHLVCDATTIESLIQRLGRVNRRGKGWAKVVLVREPVKSKDGKPIELKDLDLAISNTLKLLDGVRELSPKHISALKLSEAWKTGYKNACSPEPVCVDLTDILLDGWSMTSITEPMPGRPAVDPWLRGIAEWEPPQTTIAWRAELDLDGFADLDPDEIEEWFDTHRILAHETLNVKTSDAATWLKERWGAIPESRQLVLSKLSVVINRAGLEIIGLGEIMNRLSRKSSDADAFMRGAALLIPASFGGIRRGVGLLDPDEPKLDKSEEKKTHEVQKAILEARQNSIDVADIAPKPTRQRIVDATIDGKKQEPQIIGGGEEPKPRASLRIELESDDDKIVRLVSYIPRFEKTETGSKPQTLKDHVCTVRLYADQIIKALQLEADDPICLAVELAAAFHDHGKNRERWQRLLVFPKDFIVPNEPMGKSGGEMKRDPRGYRHEFGSLREFTDVNHQKIGQEVFDLAMHLIAVHHGRGRPHFPKGGFDPDAESRSDQIHTESIRRFARLQRKYGWWHLAWLENLLRCADAMASSEQPATGGVK